MIQIAQSQFDGPRPWLKSYPRAVPERLDYPELPAWGFLQEAARNFPDRVATIHGEHKRTYSELWTEANNIAAVLDSLGVKAGDRVGLLLPNMPEYVSALNGIWLTGATAVALSPLMVTEEVSAMMAKANCKAVIALDMLAALVLDGDFVPEQTLLVSLWDRLAAWEQVGYVISRKRRTGYWMFRETDSLHWLEEELEDLCDGDEPHPQCVNFNAVNVPLDSPAYILPTGGTTGSPKAVVLSHRNLVANAWQQLHWASGGRGEDTLLAVLPFFHSYGLSAILMTGVAMAGTLIVHHRFHVRKTLQLIETHKPTIYHAVPAMLNALNERLRRKPADLKSLRWVISGGAPLKAEVAEEFAGYAEAVVVEGFGLSECGPVTHVGPLDGTNRVGTIGLPLPDTDARIVDANTGLETLPIETVGELVIRGPQVMLGYLDDPEATNRAIRDGWLFTGDLAMCDADGFFRIVDRKKDLIITSGFNVYPGDVEDTLRNHPDIKDAAVIGVPDLKRGQLVKALIVMNSGCAFDEAALDAYCREHMSAAKRPRAYEEVKGDLPRNFLGKVLRRRLRENSMHDVNEAEPVSS